MVEGESARKESATAPAQQAESASLSTTVKKAYAVLSATCGLLAAIAVFTAAYGKSGFALVAATVIAFVILMAIAVGAAVLIQFRAKQVTAPVWKLTGVAVLAALIGAGAAFGISKVQTSPPTAIKPTAGPNATASPILLPTISQAPSLSPAASISTAGPVIVPPAPTSTIAQPLGATCPNGNNTAVIIPSGGTEFNVQVEVCAPAPAGHHYWLMAVLHNQGVSKTTNYYPLGDVATLPITADSAGRQVPYFGSTVSAASSDRCWQVLVAPESKQADLTSKSNVTPRQYVYSQGNQPPAGLAFASDCVTEPE